MKKENIFLTILAFAFSSLFFTSCSDDDKDSKVIVDSLTEIFKDGIKLPGQSSVMHSYITQPMIHVDDTVTITAISEKTVDISYHSSMWGDVTFHEVTISLVNDRFVLASSEGIASTITMTNPQTGVTNDYAAVLTSASLKKDASDYTLVIQMPSVMKGTTITFEKTTVATRFLNPVKLPGHSTVKHGPASMVHYEDTVTVSLSSENSINVTYHSSQWGDVTFHDVPVTLVNDRFDMTSSQTIESTITITNPHSGVSADYTAVLTSASIKKDMSDYAIVINIPAANNTCITFEEGAVAPE